MTKFKKVQYLPRQVFESRSVVIHILIIFITGTELFGIFPA